MKRYILFIFMCIYAVSGYSQKTVSVSSSELPDMSWRPVIQGSCSDLSMAWHERSVYDCIRTDMPISVDEIDRKKEPMLDMSDEVANCNSTNPITAHAKTIEKSTTKESSWSVNVGAERDIIIANLQGSIGYTSGESQTFTISIGGDSTELDGCKIWKYYKEHTIPTLKSTCVSEYTAKAKVVAKYYAAGATAPTIITVNCSHSEPVYAGSGSRTSTAIGDNWNHAKGNWKENEIIDCTY